MKKILVLTIVVVLLSGCVPQGAPTRDPMIDSLATSQAQQAEGLKMIQTQLAVQPTKAAEPTIMPTVSVVQAEPVAVSCPTEREFKELTGVTADIVREEPCAFHWRGDPATTSATHPCPWGWSCTLGVSGKNYVYVGDESLQSLTIFAGTWRLLEKYPADDAVQDKCVFLAKVQHEGQISDPKWTAYAGNFTCQ